MYVCICNQVNERTIAEAVRSGARSLDCLLQQFDIATCCGKCADDARRVIENTLVSDNMQAGYDLGRDACAVA
ncbi:MAG: (2Fe-2S)-binding protein [Gammaproteobacteria bacterium]|nr:MAG: (2Fe-2S)-binding protein [Gammaproteobacteria bacterium]